MRYLILAAGLVAMLGSVEALSLTGTGISPEIARAVADRARPHDQVLTDIIRKPGETLAFSGVKAGMVVGEFFPGGGYFTRMLSDIVGPGGHVYGLENAGWEEAVRDDQELVANGRLANVSVEGLPFGTVRFPKPLDLAWITQNYHDLKIAGFGRVDTAAFNRAVFTALKPGGIYFVLDHEAPAGTGPASISKLHRIEKAQVIREITAAGFKLIAEGAFLRNPADNHAIPVSDQRVKGHTDQYALKFQKPRV